MCTLLCTRVYTTVYTCVYLSVLGSECVLLDFMLRIQVFISSIYTSRPLDSRPLYDHTHEPSPSPTQTLSLFPPYLPLHPPTSLLLRPPESCSLLGRVPRSHWRGRVWEEPYLGLKVVGG